MAYHPEFWLLAGTVSPVLSVASSIGLSQLVQDLEPAPGWKAPPTASFARQLLQRVARRLRHPLQLRAFDDLGALYAVITAGFLLNAGVLIFSLWSLGLRKDMFPTGIAVVAVCFALISLLLQSGGIALQARRTRRNAVARKVDDLISLAETRNRPQRPSTRIAGSRSRSPR